MNKYYDIDIDGATGGDKGQEKKPILPLSNESFKDYMGRMVAFTEPPGESHSDQMIDIMNGEGAGEGRPIFFFKEIYSGAIWEVTRIDIREQNRLGWLNAVCLDPGKDHKLYKGSVGGFDAEHIFLSHKHEVSKVLASLK